MTGISLSVFSQDLKKEKQTTHPDSTAPKPKIRVIGKAYKDSIVLRWAATTPVSWLNCNTYGVRVERYTLYRNGLALQGVNRNKKILAEQLKPWPLSKWEPIADKNNLAKIAAQAIYGGSFNININQDKNPGKEKTPDLMTIVNMTQELENRHGFTLLAADQSNEVAMASALRWVDKTVRPNEKYLYRIFSLVPDTMQKIDTGYVFLDASERIEIPKPRELRIESDDKLVKLSWNKKFFESIFSGYIIERSDDNGISYKRLDQALYINPSPKEGHTAELMYKVDSLPQNYKKYFYRVKGVTPFGEISAPSDTASGMGKEKVRGVNPNIATVENIDNKVLKVKWKYPVEFESKIKGFIISRARSTDSVYRDIVTSPLTPASREYTDPKPGKVNYYIVRAIDVSGNTASSFPAFGQLIDSIPPLPPVGVKGSIDSNGIVTLHWKKGKEDDIFGYRVYKANNPKEEFTQVTRATNRDTIYHDTIETKTLTKKIYYQVMALDQNFNASKFSQLLELKRPDKFPPVPPRFISVLSSDTGVYLHWNHSSSNDVVKELLYRKTDTEKSWVLIAVSDSSKKIDHFTDKKLVKGKDYYYTLIAVDDSKLESEPDMPITGRLIDLHIRPAIIKITSQVDLTTQLVQLNWIYKEQGINQFVVYRSENSEPYRIYKILPKDEFSLTDKNIKINTVYKYMIRANFEGGDNSAMSKEIVVKY